jgi:transcriptional regulator with XRE-family HTH domain
MEKGYSQEYLAQKLDMSQSNYCKLESNHHFPSQDTIEKIAMLYQITPQELIAGEGNTQIQYNQNHDQSHTVNAFLVMQDPQKLAEDLLASKDKIISLQARQIELLESQMQHMKVKEL